MNNITDIGPCVEWTGAINASGYGNVRIDGKVMCVHRDAYRSYYGLSWEDIKDLIVRHKCDNPCCANPFHLELGTKYDNAWDRQKRGRGKQPKGQDHVLAKLTNEQVLEIRSRYVPNCLINGGRALSREFKISQPVVQKIISRQAWKHL